MKRLLKYIFVLFILAGCGQDYNSSSGDFGEYAPIEGIDSSTPEGARFLAAYKVLRQKCMSCHDWMPSLKSSAAWVGVGRVSAGNASASSTYTILSNNGGNMPPPSESQLTDEEVLVIENWINGIQ